MTEDFRYDVAFSFLSAHEALALRVSDGFADRLATFVYSKQQPDVVGRNTDGVEGFTNVFRQESRVCVILHSDGWGKKGYTHIEESAIRERAFEHGWDFLIVVCVDDAQPPKWIPTTKIWYGYTKYGLEGLLGTIDNRVTELGGRPKEDSVLERAARAEREAEFEEARRLFSTSVAGFRKAVAEVERMPELLSQRVAQLAAVSPSLGLTFAKHSATFSTFAAIGSRASFVLYWQPQSANTLRSAGLLIVEWRGRFSYGGIYGGPPKIGDFIAVPTIDYAQRVVWELGPQKKLFTTDQLFDFFLDRLLKHSSGEQH